MKVRELKELDRTELTDMFINGISGHEKEAEIAYMLALFTSMKLPLKSAIKHEVMELASDELIDLVETGILNQNDAGFDDEEKAWGMVLDTLNPEKVWDIITNINHYMKQYNSIIKPIEQLQYSMLRIFIESEADAI